MAARFGTSSLAAHQVGWQMWYFLAFLLDSLAIAGQALIGRTLGAGRSDHARAVGRRLCLWGVWLGAGFALVFLLLREQLPRLFTPEPAVLQAVGSIMVILALMQLPNAVLFVLDGLLIGALDMRFLRNALAALGAFGVLMAWLGATFGGSLQGVWLGFACFMLVRLAAMGARWLGGGWAR
jgi:Na+-driven multidrug efflux pump